MPKRSLTVAAVGLVLAALAAAGPPAQAAGPPQVAAAWSTEVVASSARLHAEINPEGTATAYHFDYITQAAYEANLKASREGFYGAAKAPAGADPSIGEGSAAVSVFQTLGNLSPETAYRYRAVAHSSAGSAEAARGFTTEGFASGTRLLDARGWEMVSPVDKNGGAVGDPGQSFGGGVLQAAASGEAATYSSLTAFGEAPPGAPPASQYISRRTASGWQTQNITAPTVSGAYGDKPDGVPYQLFSADLARAVMLNGLRCAEAEPCPRSYSLWEGGLTELPGTSGLRFEGAAPDLRHLVFGGEGGLEEWSGGGLAALSAAPGAKLAAQGAGAISQDGSRVYFTDEGKLYLREGSSTHQVDEAQGGGGAFQAASADGQVALFSKGEHLFRYEAASHSATDLTPAGGVEGVLGASEDASVLYYQTTAGLYRWQSPGTATQIAPGSEAAQESDWPPTTGTARVSADGAELAFVSRQPLSGYENTDQASGQPDSEVFLWSASGGLACVSCNPTGERPLGPASIPGAISNGEGPLAADSYKPRALSASGRRLFFDSRDSLVIQDTDNAPDAYEWEAPGEGSCQRSGGCLALLSSGRSAEGATFVDASASGSDAFFLTDGSLVPSDPGSTDLYDAREGGGFAEPEKPIPCEGDACQPLVPEPEDPNPGTLLPSGGNPPLQIAKPERCKAGTVRRHHRCERKGRHHRAHRRRKRGRR